MIRRIGRTVILLMAALALAAPLAACGKAGPPTLKKGESDQFPRSYPGQ